jgi:hypothetical protein
MNGKMLYQLTNMLLSSETWTVWCAGFHSVVFAFLQQLSLILQRHCFSHDDAATAAAAAATSYQTPVPSQSSSTLDC